MRFWSFSAPGLVILRLACALGGGVGPWGWCRSALRHFYNIPLCLTALLQHKHKELVEAKQQFRIGLSLAYKENGNPNYQGMELPDFSEARMCSFD